MKQSNKTEWAIWGVCALSFAVTLALLPLLPARIPVHWNVDGQIDGWAARPGAFFCSRTSHRKCISLSMGR